jgi:2-hydroxy-6-oxonona-2,4-dienedioate hydrolase
VSDYRDCAFRWLERGEGEPVLFLHGLMGRMDHWEVTLDRLSAACRPMALSLPIFEPRLPEASIEALADHVRAFLDALEIPRAVLGGNSLGGHVALRVALAAPERVSGLVLTGSSGLFERGFTRGVPHRPSAAFVREKMEEIFHDPGLVTPEWVESVRQLVSAPASALRVLRFARAARRDNVEDRLGDVRLPTLLVWGREDRITPPEVAERFRRLIPDAQLLYISSCGHAPMLEWPDRFAAAVAWWLHASRERRATPALVAGAAR